MHVRFFAQCQHLLGYKQVQNNKYLCTSFQDGPFEMGFEYIKNSSSNASHYARSSYLMFERGVNYANITV